MCICQIFFLNEILLCGSGQPRIHYIDQDDFKFIMIPLILLPKCYNCRIRPPHIAFGLSGTKLYVEQATVELDMQ